MRYKTQTRPIERHGSEFKVAPQQTPPAQTGAQVFRTKKIFVAERGILSHCYTAGIQVRARQNPRVQTRNLHCTSECSFETCYEVRVHVESPSQQGHSDL